MGAVLFYAMVLLLVYALYRVFEPFLAALAWAVVIVVISSGEICRYSEQEPGGPIACACAIGRE